MTGACHEIRRAAKATSEGACARYVRAAIQRARGEEEKGANIGSAKDFGPWLLSKGYSRVNRRHQEAQNGDVAILNATNKHPHGHIAIYCDGTWYSDFRQRNFNIWSDVPAPSYVMYAYTG